MQGKNSDQDDIKLEEEIQRIYGCISLHEKLNPKVHSN